MYGCFDPSPWATATLFVGRFRGQKAWSSGAVGAAFEVTGQKWSIGAVLRWVALEGTRWSIHDFLTCFHHCLRLRVHPSIHGQLQRHLSCRTSGYEMNRKANILVASDRS